MAYVHHVLRACAGNKSEAARALGISRRRLYHWLDAAERTVRSRPLPLRKRANAQNRDETDLHAIFDLERWLTAPPLSEIEYSAIKAWFQACHVPGKVGAIESVDAALRLVSHVVANHPTCRLASCASHTRRLRVVAWSAQLERLHTDDGIEWHDVLRVLLWSQQHDRWRRLVLGGDALRMHWDAIVTEMAAAEGFLTVSQEQR